MLKRLLKVAFFTGAAHIVTLFSLKYISTYVSAIELKSVGEIDSLTSLIITIISLGLLMATVRDIAISENWKLDFREAQQARLTMSLCLFPLGFLSVFESNYLIFFFSPVFALNGDYVLYGRSFPVVASVLAFIKVFVPAITLIFTSLYYPKFLIHFFAASIILSHIFTGYFVAQALKLPYLLGPDSKVIIKYLYTLQLGLVSLSFYFLGLGLIWIATFFYTDIIIAKAYLGIKLYVIFKGVLRIINQSFIKELTKDEIGMNVDKLAFMAGCLFFAGAIIFHDSFTMLFWGNQFVQGKWTLLLLVLSGLICAGFTSFTTKVILEKKDKSYAKWAVWSILCSLITVVFLSIFFHSVNSIYFSLLLGEVVLSIGLLKIVDNYGSVKKRFKNMLSLMPFLIIPLLVRFIFGDNFVSFSLGIVIYGFVLLITQYKKLGFNLDVVNIKNAKN